MTHLGDKVAEHLFEMRLTGLSTKQGLNLLKFVKNRLSKAERVIRNLTVEIENPNRKIPFSLLESTKTKVEADLKQFSLDYLKKIEEFASPKGLFERLLYVRIKTDLVRTVLKHTEMQERKGFIEKGEKLFDSFMEESEKCLEFSDFLYISTIINYANFLLKFQYKGSEAYDLVSQAWQKCLSIVKKKGDSATDTAVLQLYALKNKLEDYI